MDLMRRFQTIGLLTDVEKHSSVLEKLSDWFAIRHLTTVILNRNMPVFQPLDLVVVLGGDGSMLYALKHCGECPVLGINYGHVGFLTAGNQEELESILERVLNHDYHLSQRFMLECQYPGVSLKDSMRWSFGGHHG